eukprot:Hpha_TRINITY_DN11159_c0_g1::TRINITY_DN11159_c0_g1_i1::g.28017::m.28017
MAVLMEGSVVSEDTAGAPVVEQGDMLLVIEACEKDGPSLVHFVDSFGELGASEFLEAQEGTARDAVSGLVLRVLSTDHHYRPLEEEGNWTPGPDHQTLLPDISFGGRLLHGYVHYFFLPDLAARGHTRPHAAVYLTAHSEKLAAYFPRLREWVGAAVMEWKLGAWAEFQAKVAWLCGGAEVVRLSPPNESQGDRVLSDAELEVIRREAVILRQRGDTLTELARSLGVDSRFHSIRPRFRGAALRQGAWAETLLTFAERRPAREKLPQLREVVGEYFWEQGMVRLVHLLQVLGRPPLELALMEDDWASVDVTTDAGPEGTLPPSAVSFGQVLVGGCDLPAYEALSLAPFTPRAAALNRAACPARTEAAAAASVPEIAEVGAAALLDLHLALHGGVTFAASALLSGCPLLVTGTEGSEDTWGTVRWAVRGLHLLVPACAGRDPEGVVPWREGTIAFSELGMLRLVGCSGEHQLESPGEAHVAVLDLESRVTRGVRYKGRLLSELFEPRAWGSSRTFAAHLRCWLHRVCLRAAVHFHQSLIGIADAHQSLIGIADAPEATDPPSVLNLQGGDRVPRGDTAILVHISGLLRDCSAGGPLLTDCDASVSTPARPLAPSEQAQPFPVFRVRNCRRAAKR